MLFASYLVVCVCGRGWGVLPPRGLRVWLLFCVSPRGRVMVANRFSSVVDRSLLLCVYVAIGHALAFALTCRPNSVVVENTDAH